MKWSGTSGNAATLTSLLDKLGGYPRAATPIGGGVHMAGAQTITAAAGTAFHVAQELAERMTDPVALAVLTPEEQTTLATLTASAQIVVRIPTDSDLLLPQARLFDTETTGDRITSEVVPRLEAMTGKTVTIVQDGPADVVFCMADSEAIGEAPAALRSQLGALKAANLAAHILYCDGTSAVWVVAKERRALVHAAFRYLWALGYIPLGHGVGWDHLPQCDCYRIDVTGVQEPAVEMLFFDGNGGLGPENQPPLANSEAPKLQIERWRDRCAMPHEVHGIGGHQGEAFNIYAQSQLRADRTMLSWYGGARGKAVNGTPFPTSCFSVVHTAKPCLTHHGDGTGWLGTPPTPPWQGITLGGKLCTLGTDPANDPEPAQDPNDDSAVAPNPGVYSGEGGVLGLWNRRLIESLATSIQTWGAWHPNNRQVSTEQADGGNDCECTKCMGLFRDGPYQPYLPPALHDADAPPADRAAHFINASAQTIQRWFGDGVRVSALAYASRSALPNIPLHKGVIMQLVVAAQDGKSTNLTETEYVQAWGTKRLANPWGKFALSATQQRSLTNTNRDKPKMSAATAQAQTRMLLEAGVSAFTIQNTYSVIVDGLFLLGQCRDLWGAPTDPGYASLLDAWCDAAVGADAGPHVRAMLARWHSYFELTHNELGASYRDMLAAQAAADAGSITAAEQARLDQLKGFVRFLELLEGYEATYTAYVADPTGALAAHEAAIDALYQHIWDMYPSGLLHSFRLHRSIYFYVPGALVQPDGTYQATPGTVAARWLLTDANAAGWATVTQTISTAAAQAWCVAGSAAYPEFAARIEWNMSSAAPVAQSQDATVIWSHAFSGRVHFVVHKSNASPSEIRLNRLGTVAAGNLPLRVHVTDPEGTATVHDVAVNPNNVVEWTESAVSVAGPAGLYQIMVQTNDFSVQWKIGAAKSVPLAIAPPMRIGTLGFSSSTPLYFWVPAGTTKVVLSYNSDLPIVMHDSTGAALTTTRRGQHEWSADVPAGEDDKVWHLTGADDHDSATVLRFENCPPLLSFSAEQAMLAQVMQ